MLGVELGDREADLLRRMARPYDPIRVIAALLGLPSRASPPAGRGGAGHQRRGGGPPRRHAHHRALPGHRHHRPARAVRRRASEARCSGRETMSARSASAGDPGLFVCATTAKAYDTDENRVLKAALDTIRRAGRDAEHGMDGYSDDVIRRARHNGHRAAHLVEHQTLSQVPVARIDRSDAPPDASRAAGDTPTHRPSPSCNGPTSRWALTIWAPSPTSRPLLSTTCWPPSCAWSRSARASRAGSGATTAGSRQGW